MTDKCFWCDEPFVSLLGLYQPCPACQTKMREAVTVIEVASAAELQRPELIVSAAPTGRWFMCDQERFLVIAAFLQLSDAHVIPVLTERRMFTEKLIYDRILPIELTAKKVHS